VSQQQMPGYAPQPVAHYGADVRTRFMTRVYLNLIGGIAAFIAVETYLFVSGLAYDIARAINSTSWLLVLGGFMLVSWLGSSFAWKATSPAAQYGGYAAMIAVYSIIFTLPLVIAEQNFKGVISTAAWISVLAFVGLSGIALTTSKDFKFLRGLLMWGGMLALGAIVAAVIFPSIQLGAWFSVAMIGLAGGAILYDTQKIYHSYPPDREVAAAMSLFASVALMFWYVLRLLSRR
jgi:FtsH-binding integral membrane protein